MTSRNQALVEGIHAVLGDRVVSVADAHGEIALVVRAGDLIEAMTALRDRAELRFEQLMDLCGVDYSEFSAASGEAVAVAPRDGSAPPDAGVSSVPGARFAVVYHLLSIANNWRLRVRTFAVDDDFPVVSSVVGLWPSANWFEREAFDLFGIVFDGHPDLRRILTDYGFIGHPFRKDFPISGNVEMRYDPDQQRVIYQPVTIEPREITPRITREAHYADSEGFRKG